ncbi:MAG: CBS domain-containing protein [Pyrinomonadaceae bacterium]|nr:CBS domain-containing protein [Pyrinomonadaceae bacterium]
MENSNIHNTIDPNSVDNLNEPILKYIRTDFPRINVTLTVEGALRVIRYQGIGERIVYFYVLDNEERLVGIIPTRKLLTSMPSVPVREIMSTDIISLPYTAKVLDACEMFVRHKLLAFPVIDEGGHICGVIDAGLFTDETLSFAERHHFDDVFQIIGFGISQIKGKSPIGIFKYRFPWLLATMTSGTICALLTGMYEATLAQTLVLAFFMTLVLALGESVSIQSMTVALQNLHMGNPGLSGYFGWLKTEGMATALLGIACGVMVGMIALLWRGDAAAAVVIGSSISLTVFAAGIIGMSVPTLLHSIHEESKIASGPITLAMADIFTLVVYFNVAAMVLG